VVEGAVVFQGVVIVETRGSVPSEVKGLSCDSRMVRPGELFVALRGTAFDGHRFLSDAAARGACAAVVEEWGEAPLPQIRVNDTLAALPTLAANVYSHPSRKLRMVGVTGSNGKTTSTYVLEKIWKTIGEDVAVIGTIEYRYGGRKIEASNTTPLPHELQRLLRQIADAGVSRVVMEVSSHGLALHRVDEIAFDAALFTNLSQDHLDFHKDMDEYRDVKKRLFTEYLKPGGSAVINWDDEAGRIIAREIRGKRLVTYAWNQDADVTVRDVDIRLIGSLFTLIFPEEDFVVRTRLVGRYNIYNLLGSAATAWACGVPLEAICEGIQQFSQVPGRLESVPNCIGAQVVVDYCHTPDAMQKCLETLAALPHRRILTLFGCGGDRDRTKRPIMGEIALRLSDRVIVTSDNPRTEAPLQIIREIEAGMAFGRNRYVVIPDRREALRMGVDELQPGDVFLIAGKGHETYQIIGREKFPFDDREIARSLLIELGKG